MAAGKTQSTVRRLVTGHDAEGNAIFRSVDDLLPEMIPTGDAAFATIWSTAEVPVDLNDEKDGAARDVGLTLRQGSVARIVDMLPGGESPPHRTNSIDYGVVLSGTVELELDDSVVETCSPGDVIVQRGTMHRWRNPSANEVCRILFVLIEAEAPYRVRGKALTEVQPG